MRSRISVENACIKLNEFRIAFPTFRSKDFAEYSKIENIPYANLLLTEFVKRHVITRTSYGQYTWQLEPLHISKLNMIYKDCKEKCSIKKQVKQQLDLKIDSFIETLEDKGLKVVSPEKPENNVSDEQMINVLKALGFKILKPVQTFEEL